MINVTSTGGRGMINKRLLAAVFCCWAAPVDVIESLVDVAPSALVQFEVAIAQLGGGRLRRTLQWDAISWSTDRVSWMKLKITGAWSFMEGDVVQGDIPKMIPSNRSLKNYLNRKNFDWVTERFLIRSSSILPGRGQKKQQSDGLRAKYCQPLRLATTTGVRYHQRSAE